MANKKPNGFMVFTFEWKERNGRNMSLAQATENAGKIWKSMTAAEREPYKLRSQTFSRPVKNKVKLTCAGTPIDVIEKRRLEKQEFAQLMTENIKNTIQLSKKIKSEKFYFIMVNHFTKLFNTNIYVPAEIAVIEFSLEDGVKRQYHTYVNPNCNFGNYYEAQQQSATTHLLPLPPKAFGGSNLPNIYDEILNFIYNEQSKSYPPIYTLVKEIDCIKSALNFLIGQDPNDSLKVEIYSINELLFYLKCEVSSTKKPKNSYITDVILQRDFFEYTPNIGCKYHEDIDRSHYCVLSQTVRWAYTFADYMCEDLSIKLIPGRHIPKIVNLESQKHSKRDSPHEEQIDTICGAVSKFSISTSKTITESSQFRKKSENSNLSKVYNDTFQSESGTDRWKRHKDSNPPDESYFSIDCDDNEAKALSNTSNSILERRRGRGRGRGIIVWDDIKCKK